LINQKTGEEFTFITSSVGGRTAVGEITQQICNIRSAHPGAKPIVQLGSTKWRVRKMDLMRPQFHVVDWIKGPERNPPQQLIDNAGHLDWDGPDDDCPL
jgi:hypothetical protein